MAVPALSVLGLTREETAMLVLAFYLVIVILALVVRATFGRLGEDSGEEEE